MLFLNLYNYYNNILYVYIKVDWVFSVFSTKKPLFFWVCSVFWVYNYK